MTIVELAKELQEVIYPGLVRPDRQIAGICLDAAEYLLKNYSLKRKPKN